MKIENIINKGAEATVYSGTFLGVNAIFKERKSKRYRSKGIDEKLRRERSIQEVRILNLALEHDLPVPRILDLDKEKWMIAMSEVPGINIKEMIDKIDIREIFSQIGRIIGKFHEIDIIHGDLTTSNIFIDNSDIYFIDFGLGYISLEIEDKAVDLLVLKHTVESSHPDISDIAIKALMEGYSKHYKLGKSIVKRMKVIEGRVRYRDHTFA